MVGTPSEGSSPSRINAKGKRAQYMREWQKEKAIVEAKGTGSSYRPKARPLRASIRERKGKAEESGKRKEKDSKESNGPSGTNQSEMWKLLNDPLPISELNRARMAMKREVIACILRANRIEEALHRKARAADVLFHEEIHVLPANMRLADFTEKANRFRSACDLLFSSSRSLLDC